MSEPKETVYGDAEIAAKLHLGDMLYAIASRLGDGEVSEPVLDTVRPLIAIQPQRRIGGADFGAEFLCLNPRSGGQRQPGNAGGKPEVILYFRARAGLASGRSCFEHQYVQSLGGAVHGGSQA